MISFRDPLLSEDDYYDGGDEHGSAFERISAFQFGFTDGPSACAAIDTKEIAARRGDLPVELPSNETGELPVTEESTRSIIDAMNVLFKPENPPSLTFDEASAQKCPDARPSPPTSYCPETNTIVVAIVTGLIWTTEALRLLFVIEFMPFHVQIGISGAFFIALIASLLTAVPFTPAGLGLADGAMIFVLTAVYHVPQTEAVANTLVDRAISVLSVIVVGGIAYTVGAIVYAAKRPKPSSAPGTTTASSSPSPTISSKPWAKRHSAPSASRSTSSTTSNTSCPKSPATCGFNPTRWPVQ